MRIYRDQLEMIREVERDLWEMGIHVHPQTMQDKQVGNNPDYDTKELRAYGFSVTNPLENVDDMVSYLFKDSGWDPITYCLDELGDRLAPEPLNPGRSWKNRPEVWNEFMHKGKFSYTYSERIQPQFKRILEELQTNPETRQAIINIHSNLYGDLEKVGGKARIPCSMYYQFMLREGKLEIIYTMRSCDFLTHFPIDIWLAANLQEAAANAIGAPVGPLSFFTGSLHAYQKDMKARGIY